MFGRRGPSHIPIVAGAGARGRNGLIYRPFMSLQCSLAVFEFICGGRPTGWSWAQMGFECSMPAWPLPIGAGITPHLFVCSHGSTGAAACRGALVCGQRAGIHGFLTCHPPTLQVDEEVGAARAFAHCSFHGRRWRCLGPSVRIRRFYGPPVRTTAWHLRAAVWCSSPDPPPDPRTYP